MEYDEDGFAYYRESGNRYYKRNSYTYNADFAYGDFPENGPVNTWYGNYMYVGTKGSFSNNGYYLYNANDAERLMESVIKDMFYLNYSFLNGNWTNGGTIKGTIRIKNVEKRATGITLYRDGLTNGGGINHITMKHFIDISDAVKKVNCTHGSISG